MKKIILSVTVFTFVFAISIQALAQEKAKPEEIVEMTQKAAAFLSQAGETGLKEFDERNGRWVWKDTYVFVYNCDKGTIVAHPIKPHLIGKNLMGLRDIKGNLLFVQLCEAARNAKGEWTEYWWPKPGEKTPLRKVSLMLQAPNTPYQVGAGIYDDDVSIETLQKLTQ